jgi:hypothetical protein
MELLTGLGLASAAGLNAYIPLLAMGLLARFTELVNLPPGWAWLENGWVMVIVAVLLIIEVVADKIPALDSVNDAIQTVDRRHRPRGVRHVRPMDSDRHRRRGGAGHALDEDGGPAGGQRRDRRTCRPGVEHH